MQPNRNPLWLHDPNQIASGVAGEVHADPEDRRIKIVTLTDFGNELRQHAQRVVHELTDVLVHRIGQRQVDALRDAFSLSWGEPVAIDLLKRPTDP